MGDHEAALKEFEKVKQYNERAREFAKHVEKGILDIRVALYLDIDNEINLIRNYHAKSVKFLNYLSIAVVIVIVGCCYFFASTAIVNPIQKLAKGVDRISRGHLDHRVEVKGGDEFGQLADAFNKMARNLDKSTISRDQLDSILNAAGEAVMITDVEGRIEYVNQAFEDITGFVKNEVLGETPRILKSDKQNPKYYMELWKTILDGKVWHGDLVNRTKKGRLFDAEQTICPIKAQDGSIENFVSIFRDVTEHNIMEKQIKLSNKLLTENEQKIRTALTDLQETNKILKETQRQVLQAEKLASIGQLSAGISHEIKNPLAIISLSLEELESKMDSLDEDSKEQVKMIRKSADRANRVILDLLRFSRLSDLKFQPVDVHKSIDEAIEFCRNKSKEKSVKFSLNYSDSVGRIEGDVILLVQVFLNLISNAIDAIEEEGEVAVNTYSDTKNGQESVVIEISDDGEGIPEEYVQKVFDPFFTTKEQGKGTGLGLSTVYTIVKAHNGSISLDNNTEKGTKFIIVLPVKA